MLVGMICWVPLDLPLLWENMKVSGVASIQYTVDQLAIIIQALQFHLSTVELAAMVFWIPPLLWKNMKASNVASIQCVVTN